MVGVLSLDVISSPRARWRARVRAPETTALRERRGAAIPKAGPLEECLEGAVVPDVAELGPGRIERDGLLGELPRVRKHERGVGVDEPLDEPGRGDPVHVGPAARDPLPPSEVPEIARGLLSSFRLLGWSCA